MATKFVPPDLSNATPSMLCDEMGKLSVVENYVKKLRAVYKEAFLARTGINVDELLNGQSIINEGDTFVITTTRSDPERVNVKRLQEERPEIAEEFKESKPQLTSRPSLKEGVLNPIVNDLLEQMKRELDLD